jgi:hypothetical protein
MRHEEDFASHFPGVERRQGRGMRHEAALKRREGEGTRVEVEIAAREMEGKRRGEQGMWLAERFSRSAGGIGLFDN